MDLFKKLLFVCVLVVGCAFLGSKAFCADYTVTCTTYTVTGTTNSFASGAYPNITGGVNLEGLYLVNTSTYVYQTIQVYDTATSTSAASLAISLSVTPQNGTLPGYEYINFKPRRLMKLTSPAIRCSSTDGSVYATFLYE